MFANHTATDPESVTVVGSLDVLFQDQDACVALSCFLLAILLLATIEHRANSAHCMAVSSAAAEPAAPRLDAQAHN